MKKLTAPIFLNSITPDTLRRLANHGARKWYEIRNETKESVDISIMDEIGFWGTSAREFVTYLKSLSETVTVNLYIYSPGGSIFEGTEIYNALQAHKGAVNVTLGSLCASIATLIALSGNKISMPKNGHFMIHDPSCFTGGSSADLRRCADLMDTMKNNLIDVYHARTSIDKTELSQLMADETWFTADVAKERGFIDEVIDTLEDDEDDPADKFDLSQFRNCTISPKGKQKGAGGPNPPPAPGGPGAEPKGKPSGGSSLESTNKTINKIKDSYMKGTTRIFAAHAGLFAASAATRFYHKKPDDAAFGGGDNGGTPAIILNDDPADPATAQAVQKAAVELYKAKIKRDKEIDDIVLKVRERDKKDFSALAARFKQDDKTVAEFSMALATSDEFIPHNVSGSGIEVVGVQGLPKGTPGEAFVASDAYKHFIDKVKRGSREKSSVLVECQGFLNAAMYAAMGMPMPQNVTTSSGLTSIEKLPGVVTLGVRPLTVKDLIAPGATNSTTIRYIREVSFTNAATTVAEGAAKPQASFALEEVDATVKKIAAYTKVTDELFADYLAVASFINMRLPYMVERTEEDQLLNGNGVGTNLTGILATAGIQTQAKGADTALDALYKAITKVRWGNLAGTAQGGFEPDGFVMHPTDWEGIRLTKDANGQYFGGGPFTGAYGNGGGLVQFEMVWGKPVVVTPAIAQGTALCGAFRLASQYFQRQGLVIESTNTDQDDFIKNLTTIRAELRLALAVYRALAFCQVTGL